MSDRAFKHLEDKRHCPHCSKPLHTQRYMMARDPNAEIDWRILSLALYVVVFVAAVLIFHGI
jgi:hypothetical protein